MPPNPHDSVIARGCAQDPFLGTKIICDHRNHPQTHAGQGFGTSEVTYSPDIWVSAGYAERTSRSISRARPSSAAIGRTTDRALPLPVHLFSDDTMVSFRLYQHIEEEAELQS